jgi:hypothetical protein
MSITKSLKLGFTNMDIADNCPYFLEKFNQDFERKVLDYGRVTDKVGG